jgi:predicted RNase H-like nuclease (RuvC/YqgF family)
MYLDTPIPRRYDFSMNADKLKHLENQIDRLIETVKTLRTENQDLKGKNEELEKEKERLSSQHETSKAELEKIDRLEKRLQKLTESNSKAKSEMKNILKTIENNNFF